LLFNAAGEAVGVIKAATSPHGRALIQREADFLEAMASVQGVPRECGRFSSSEVEAFALDFIRGRPPKANDISGLARTVGAWIDPDRVVSLSEIPAWRRVDFRQKFAALADCRVHPVVFHGDLAPWNVRVDRGQWTALDWERGEKVGVPAWDWFHFELQHAILVRRLAPRKLVALAKVILSRPEFQRYAQAAGVANCAGILLLAYLDFAAEVLQPVEGLESLRALRRALEEAFPSP
jgi:aminoglycoside phosphotransferase (APT) family kinase protein